MISTDEPALQGADEGEQELHLKEQQQLLQEPLRPTSGPLKCPKGTPVDPSQELVLQEEVAPGNAAESSSGELTDPSPHAREPTVHLQAYTVEPDQCQEVPHEPQLAPEVAQEPMPPLRRSKRFLVAKSRGVKRKLEVEHTGLPNLTLLCSYIVRKSARRQKKISKNSLK